MFSRRLQSPVRNARWASCFWYRKDALTVTHTSAKVPGGLILVTCVAFCGCGKPDVTPGGATVKELMLRLHEAQQNNDAALAMTCFPIATEEQKATARVLAKDLLIAPRARAFMEKGQAKFGDEFQRAVGPCCMIAGFRTMVFSFDKAAENEPETKDGVTRIAVPVGRMGNARIQLQQVDRRWYLKSSKPVEQAVEQARQLDRLLTDVGKLTETAPDLKTFGEQVIPVLEAINPAWAEATRKQREHDVPGVTAPATSADPE